MMQNRLKDRDRGGYTSDRYRPHDNYTNAFNMLAQIGLAEKEVTNSMRNAITQAANVKALQDRLKFDVSSYRAKLKQAALDYNTGQRMKYEELIQTYMDSKEEERKEKIKKWAEDYEDDDNEDDEDALKKAFDNYKEKVYKEDMDAAKEIYKAISDSINNHSKDTKKYIEEFDNVFSFHPNNSDVLGNKIEKWVENSQDNYYNDSAFIKAVKKHKKEVYEMDIDTAKEKDKAILDSINNHSKATQEYIKEFDNAKFSLYPNNSDVLGNKNFFRNANDVFSLYPNNSDKAILDSINSHSKDTQEYIKEFNYANPFGFYPNKSILGSINNHSNKTQKYIGEFDNASVWKIIGSSIRRTNAIIGEFFKNLFSKGGEG